MKNNDLVSLHEELLLFLLNYRKESKYFDTPNFLFRPITDVEAFKEGRWFYDTPISGWINIYFTENIEKKQIANHPQFINNLQFGVNLNGRWNISVSFPVEFQGESVSLFWKHLIQSFSNTAAESFSNAAIRHRDNEFFERFKSRRILLLPFDKNYRTGLPQAFDNLFQFFKYEQNSIEYQDKASLPLSFISENVFRESLSHINEYRNQHKVERVYLNGFQIKNFQGVKDTQLHELPPNSRWIFLTGENGFGKTCLLKALAIGLYGDEEDIIIPRSKDPEIKTSYTNIYRSGREITINNDIKHPLFFRSLQTLAAYGPSRLEIQAQDSHRQQAKNSTATYNLFHTDGVLKNIEAELLISHYDAPSKFDELCKMLKALIPSLNKIELDKDQRKILYYERDKIDDKEQTSIFAPIEYEHLASGIRSIIAMVGDIYLRLSNAQQRRYLNLLGKSGVEKQSNDHSIYTPRELFGIVIIDELDLHLHPKWQRELPTLLSEVFPNVQFIASTHSPIPLLGAPLNSIFLKVDRSVESGIIVKRLTGLEKNISNLLPNSILTSPIFDLDHFFPVTHDSDEPIETADYYRTILEKNALEEKLQILARDFKFPEELKKGDNEKGQ
ncbi:AAA family ATPase [Candidatus Dojkabacteria bacterium]|nr:AAA family ATPase [Candidatus Dojkabacteria bacterium]